MRRFENTLRRFDHIVQSAVSGANMDSPYTYDIAGEGIHVNELFISRDFVLIGIVEGADGYATKATSYSFDFVKYFKYKKELASISSGFVIEYNGEAYNEEATNGVYDES